MSDVEVIILGVGAAIPMRGGTNSAYVLRARGATILIDCGPAILQQLDQVGVSPAELTHVFVTHRHGDHALGYPMLMLWYAIKQPPGSWVPVVVGSDLTLSALDILMQNAYGSILSTLANKLSRVPLPQFAPATSQLTEDISLQTWPMVHSDFAPVLGGRFEIQNGRNKCVVAFTGDTQSCPNIVELARDADLLVHDANYSAVLTPEAEGGMFGHSTAKEAAKNAAAASVKQLALVHVDSLYEGHAKKLVEEAKREFSGDIVMPAAGDRIRL